MPYIAGEDRVALEPDSLRDAMTVGELTFQITVLVDGYLAGNVDYQALAEAIAALECAKLELYRRLVAPYENHKIDLNGDVYVTQIPSHGVKKSVQL